MWWRLALLFLAHCLRNTTQEPNLTEVSLRAPPDDAILQWTTKCNKEDDGWFQLIETLLPSTGGIFYDVTAGYGHSFIRLALKVGPGGSAIGIDRNTTKLAILQENVGRFDLWSRSLIAQNYNISDPMGRFHEKSFFQELHAMLSWQCPHLIHFRENGEDFQDLSHTFGDMKFILPLCSPILYFDFMRVESFIQFAEEILNVTDVYGNRNYELFMLPLCCRDTTTKLIRYGLFAIINTLLSSNNNRLIELHGGIAITSLKGLRKIATQSCDYIMMTNEHLVEKDRDSAEDSAVKSSINRGKYLGRVEMDFDMIYYPFGIIKCLHTFQLIQKDRYNDEDYFYAVDLFMQEENKRTSVSVDEDNGGPSMPEPDDDLQDGYHSLVMLINKECFSWINVIIEKLVKELEYGAAPICLCNNTTLDQLGPEKLAALSHCFQFANERLRFLKTMFDRRNVFESQNIYNHSLLGESMVKSIRYINYDYGSHLHIKQWFRRRPFEYHYVSDICTEPIFCSYGDNFQKALFRWQYPPRLRKDINVSIVSNQLNRVNANYLPNHSCEDAKYLVYEPPSGLHGIGSMLLLVAAAQRYAICLDRILLLSTHEQQNTILKWEPKGCNVNIFECYFEPISSCGSVITLDELQRANISVNGEGFDQHPLRDQRVLILRGAPERGVCGLCFDEWPSNSRFFDGMMTMYNEDTDRYSRDVYTEIFTYKSRLPWLSQLTRGLMKPRQWLVDAIQEIVMASMVSPEDVENNFVFPRHFISLHIRHGMKYVETVLYKAQKYMMVIQAKFPLMTDIFVSTETQAIIEELIQ